MGYDTEFTGEFTVSPPMSKEILDILKVLSTTRRMARDEYKLANKLGLSEKQCGLIYGIEGELYGDEEEEGDLCLLYDYNTPPLTQPGLWNNWEAVSNTTIRYNDAEKFYNYVEWIEYIVKLLDGGDYIVTGSVEFSNKYEHGCITIVDNKVCVK